MRSYSNRFTPAELRYRQEQEDREQSLALMTVFNKAFNAKHKIADFVLLTDSTKVLDAYNNMLHNHNSDFNG
jgi:hypothetical protein